MIHKKAGFVEQNGGKINFTTSRRKESCRNLRSGEKFQQAGRGTKMVLILENEMMFPPPPATREPPGVLVRINFAGFWIASLLPV